MRTHVVSRRVLAISVSSYVLLQDVTSGKTRLVSQVFHTHYTVYIYKEAVCEEHILQCQTVFSFHHAHLNY